MPFAAFLDESLTLARIRKSSLCEWIWAHPIVRPQDKPNAPAQTHHGFSTPNSVKEHLRHLQKKGAHALAYETLPEIIAFFRHKGHPAVASYLEHIAFQQAFDLGLLADLYPPESPLHRKLWWAFFPTAIPSRDALAEWYQEVRNEDQTLYSHTYSFYIQFKFSHAQSKTRLALSIELARACITYGDYSKCYVICKRYADAFEWHYKGSRSEWRSLLIEKDRNRAPFINKGFLDDFERYIRSLVYRASAVSFIFSNFPHAASEGLFQHTRDAIQVLQEAVSATNDETAKRVSVRLEALLITHELRILTRDTLELHEPQPELALPLAVRLEALLEDRKHREFLPLDTLSRVNALILNRIDIAEKYLLESFLYPLQSTRDPLDQTSPKLKEYRMHVSKAIIDLVKMARAGHKEDLHGYYQEFSMNIESVIGYENMRHTRMQIEALRFFACMHLFAPNGRPFYKIGEARPGINSSLKRLNEEAASVREIFLDDGDAMYDVRSFRRWRRLALYEAYDVYRVKNPGRIKEAGASKRHLS